VHLIADEGKVPRLYRHIEVRALPSENRLRRDRGPSDRFWSLGWETEDEGLGYS
jgi:hypothetical protein